MPKLRIGVAGCGDVARRHYLPGIASMADEVEIVAYADPRPGAAAALATAVADWSPSATAYLDTGEMLARERLDGVFDLTPAPLPRARKPGDPRGRRGVLQREADRLERRRGGRS